LVFSTIQREIILWFLPSIPSLIQLTYSNLENAWRAQCAGEKFCLSILTYSAFFCGAGAVLGLELRTSCLIIFQIESYAFCPSQSQTTIFLPKPPL
jgi:hypothetical protein